MEHNTGKRGMKSGVPSLWNCVAFEISMCRMVWYHRASMTSNPSSVHPQPCPTDFLLLLCPSFATIRSLHRSPLTPSGPQKTFTSFAELPQWPVTNIPPCRLLFLTEILTPSFPSSSMTWLCSIVYLYSLPALPPQDKNLVLSHP